MGITAADMVGRARAKGASYPLHALPRGTQIDHYVIEDVIGAGGFGITYRARHKSLGKTFAIKEHFPSTHVYRDAESLWVMPTTLGDPATSWARDRFLEEARTLARFRHGAIVAVMSVFEANGTAYSVLEHETGRTLGHWLERLRRRPSQVELDYVLPPLLDALAVIHAANYLHRDISPDNIMLRADGSPCLIDFGSAREAMGRRAMTLTAVVKSGYSPPEQYLSEGRGQGPWTDIYALSATLYRAVTGKTLPESTERMLNPAAAPPASEAAGARYRPRFLAAIDRGLALQPEDRPRSIEAWRQELLAADASTDATLDVTATRSTGAADAKTEVPSATLQLAAAMPQPASHPVPVPPPPAEVPPALLMDDARVEAQLAERIALLLAAVAVPAILATAYAFHTLQWALVLSPAQTGLMLGSVLMLGVATALLIHRDANVGARELALYWLTIALQSALVLGLLLAHMGISAFAVADPLQGQLLTGWIAGLALVVISSLALILRRGSVLTVGEHLVYAAGWLLASGWVAAFVLRATRLPASGDAVTLLALGLLAGMLFSGAMSGLVRLMLGTQSRLTRSVP